TRRLSATSVLISALETPSQAREVTRNLRDCNEAEFARPYLRDTFLESYKTHSLATRFVGDRRARDVRIGASHPSRWFHTARRHPVDSCRRHDLRRLHLPVESGGQRH